MDGGFAGAEKRSSSVESPNKSELGLALAAGAIGFGAIGFGAIGFVVLGFEENNSSSSWSSLNKSAPFFVTAGFAVENWNKSRIWHTGLDKSFLVFVFHLKLT